MATTLEELDARVAALEKEVRALQDNMNPRYETMTDLERGLKLLRDAKASQAAISAGIARAFAKMGITGEPTMTIEELHASMLAHGVNPEDNLGSREILAMREE